MIHELTPASDATALDVLKALGVDELSEITWPLPNMEPVSANVYWQAFAEGAPDALIEIGIRKVGYRACRVWATFNEGKRGGVVIAQEIGSLEPQFFTWSACAHEWDARHDRLMSVYQCTKCQVAYRVEVEG
ncbi:hypothetical protein [Mangrovibrevibacter kandeliae]|uniref:hypothetical protein n=1 Tax=Mangrovibrevibacter kandeliae TaxID=2968473 RepID=UPI00211796D8|nr:hypothetical protein [Aurantimonas sp. CSK15Z-1]MCQ8781664.1 hypothetical protein [Aurantimonas sp. CSK15Z-1]